MLKEFEMELVYHQNFNEFFHEHRTRSEDVELMYTMQAMDRQTVSYYLACSVMHAYFPFCDLSL